jgi:hypothetical protein
MLYELGKNFRLSDWSSVGRRVTNKNSHATPAESSAASAAIQLGILSMLKKTVN